MRFGCSRSRQKATLALIIGRRFASAFVAIPSRGGLQTSTVPSGPTNYGLCPAPTAAAAWTRSRASTWSSVDRRSLHALPAGQAHFAQVVGPSTTTGRRRRASRVGHLPVSSLMMFSATSPIEGDNICRAAHILCAGESVLYFPVHIIHKTGFAVYS
ncbi:unnamed protein product [Sphacelaria rigidula]